MTSDERARAAFEAWTGPDPSMRGFNPNDLGREREGFDAGFTAGRASREGEVERGNKASVFNESLNATNRGLRDALDQAERDRDEALRGADCYRSDAQEAREERDALRDGMEGVIEGHQRVARELEIVKAHRFEPAIARARREGRAEGVEALLDVAGSTNQRGKTRSTEDAVRRVMALRERAVTAGTAKDDAYAERDRLVCALSKLFPSSLERHPDSDTEWEDDWRWIVFIDGPTGQWSWHIRDSELAWFDHLERESGRRWDGHTTDEKYERLRALAAAPPSEEKCATCNGDPEGYCPTCKRRARRRAMADERETVTIPCRYCGKGHEFALDSNEAERVFNVFCDGECEDRYAATL